MALSFSLVLVGSGYHSGAVNASSAYMDTYFAGPAGHSKPNIKNQLCGARWFAGRWQQREAQQSGLALPPTLADLGAESDEGFDMGWPAGRGVSWGDSSHLLRWRRCTWSGRSTFDAVA